MLSRLTICVFSLKAYGTNIKVAAATGKVNFLGVSERPLPPTILNAHFQYTNFLLKLLTHLSTKRKTLYVSIFLLGICMQVVVSATLT